MPESSACASLKTLKGLPPQSPSIWLLRPVYTTPIFRLFFGLLEAAEIRFDLRSISGPVNATMGKASRKSDPLQDAVTVRVFRELSAHMVRRVTKVE
ncbi:hypothetical protein MCOR29_010952 [Pyricularia oryzae]|nr:hypothetical protein MCOR29_010952 [Pyricularia oryzae]KAI6352833.1 hypothetical protein MCOR32_011114 [Pyricularia oryzae]KAI6405917.1 hypothetical protein MCOR20_006369 [Pyricularia oryzae]KAI6500985.1 hypothetical protein MCOR11_002447 [Pyricularia oryzae]KAI6555138.1 hypothetical protein MCOR03_006962 [Pyricularia oryzae]